MGYRVRVATVLGAVGMLVAVTAGCEEGIDPAGGSPTGGPPASGEPVADGDGPPVSECDVDDFRLGTWEEPGAAAVGRVTGIAAEGEAACAHLRIDFDGPAPGVRVWRPSEGNHTYVSLTADFVDVDPIGPVEEDLLWPELALLSTAILTADQAGITVVAIHGDHTDVAARAVVGAQHVDVYFRSAASGDPRVDDEWPGGPHHLAVTDESDQRLVVTHTGAADGEWVLIQGYAKAPESSVVVRVQVTGLGVACDHDLQAAGPPYLFSWFHDACQVTMPYDYKIQVGWASPAGPSDDVWQWYEVPIH